MEHIPRAQPRSCMLLDSCLYVLCMIITVACSYIYMHRGYIIHEHILQEKKRSTVVVILQLLCVFYLLLIRDTFD